MVKQEVQLAGAPAPVQVLQGELHSRFGIKLVVMESISNHVVLASLDLTVKEVPVGTRGVVKSPMFKTTVLPALTYAAVVMTISVPDITQVAITTPDMELQVNRFRVSPGAFDMTI